MFSSWLQISWNLIVSRPSTITIQAQFMVRVSRVKHHNFIMFGSGDIFSYADSSFHSDSTQCDQYHIHEIPYLSLYFKFVVLVLRVVYKPDIDEMPLQSMAQRQPFYRCIDSGLKIPRLHSKIKLLFSEVSHFIQSAVYQYKDQYVIQWTHFKSFLNPAFTYHGIHLQTLHFL